MHKNYSYLAILILLFSLVHYALSEEKKENTGQFKFFPSRQLPALGTYIVVHGLNNTPEVMNDLSGVITDLGYNAIRVTLSGHNGDDDSNVSADQWRNDIKGAIEYKEETAPGSDLFFLGFSLGAAAITSYLDNNTSIKVKKIVFLAPGIAINRYLHIVRILTPLRYLGIPAISIAPRDYREYLFPSFKLYSSFFNLYDSVRELKNPDRFFNINMKLMVVDGDELISEEGVKKWIKENKLTDTVKISKLFYDKNRLTRYNNHQIIDQRSIGEKNWEILKAFIKDN